MTIKEQTLEAIERDEMHFTPEELAEHAEALRTAGKCYRCEKPKAMIDVEEGNSLRGGVCTLCLEHLL